MMLHNESDRVKREVLVHVARALFARDLASLDRIPLAMRPRNQRFSRCCIHKDRAALRYRVMAALGFRVEDDVAHFFALGRLPFHQWTLAGFHSRGFSFSRR